MKKLRGMTLQRHSLVRGQFQTYGYSNTADWVIPVVFDAHTLPRV